MPHETRGNTVFKVLVVACNSLTSHARAWRVVSGGWGGLSSPGLTVWSLYIKLWQPANLSNFLSASHPFGLEYFDPNLNLAWLPIPCSTLSRLVAIAAPCAVNGTCLQNVNKLTKCRDSGIQQPTVNRQQRWSLERQTESARRHCCPHLSDISNSMTTINVGNLSF